MSFDQHLEAKGVELTDDNALPQGQRTQRNVKRVIAAIRAAESEFNSELREANERCRRAQEQVIALQEALRAANEQLRKQRVKEVAESMEALSVADRRKLIEVA